MTFQKHGFLFIIVVLLCWDKYYSKYQLSFPSSKTNLCEFVDKYGKAIIVVTSKRDRRYELRHNCGILQIGKKKKKMDQDAAKLYK